jgi:DNA-binding transcriptional ArsR family regulator
MALQNLPGAGVETASGVAVLQLPSQASALLYHPVRLRILEALLAPDSAAGLSRRMGIPRQTLNYHVRELLRVKLLVRMGGVVTVIFTSSRILRRREDLCFRRSCWEAWRPILRTR